MPRIEPHPPPDSPYNVDIDELMAVVPPDERGEVEDDCVWSVPELPPVGSREQERRRLVPALTAVIREYLDDHGFPRLNDLGEEVFGRYSVGEFPSGREMRFFLDHPTAIGPELVRRIRAMLAEAFPLWRIVPQYQHLVVCVYPEGVWLGAQPDGHWRADAFVPGTLEDNDPHFLGWSRQVRDLAESRLREKRKGKR